ncbi:MAG: hypothetical protein ACOX8S_05210 [Christensenellales bacterium]|jgi:predicted  nucleic acid-binding Zn-ribbon protein
MAFVKCPRCELNYMQSTDKYCQVCRRDMQGEDDQDMSGICTNCGERAALSGEEMCAVCLKEINNTEGFVMSDDEESEEGVDESVIELPDASDIEEIEIDDETIPAGEFQVIKRELGSDDDSEFDTVSLSELQEEEDRDDEEED